MFEVMSDKFGVILVLEVGGRTDKTASWADADRFQVRSNGSPGQVGQVQFGQVRTRSLVQAEKLWVGSVLGLH